MYTALLHSHSGIRYLILASLLYSVYKSLSGWFRKSNYSALDNKLALITMILVHIQLVFGLVLYYVSPKVQLNDMAITMKDSVLRYFAAEHLLLMLIAIALITIGKISAKKKTTAIQKHKTIAIFYGIALLFIVLTVYIMMPS